MPARELPRMVVYRFDRFTLDLGRGALLGPEGAELPLRPKSFALLRLLVENAGRLLDRETIMAAVWPDLFVTDDSIAQCIGSIRRALGDEAQRLLRTVPKRGYLLAAEISATEAASLRAVRRLVAILVADVVGFARLMGEDEPGTLARLKAHRQECFAPLVARHGGRVVNQPGDSILCAFASVVEAVACAVAIQVGMAAREADLPAPERLRFRIGVNAGDVLVEDNEIYGDGVNVAARLEGVAEPGGVCISGKVHDEVRGKLGLDFEDLGELALKNIADPVRAWRVADVVAAPTRPRPRPRPRPRVARRLTARDSDDLRDLSLMLDALLIRFGGVLTERREVLDRLAASEARYNALISTHDGFVARMTPSHQLSFVSDSYCRYYVRSRDELLWRSINEFTLTVPEDRERDRAHLCSLTPEHPANAIRLRRKLPDGSVRWVEWTDTGLFDGEGHLVELQSLGRDVTDGIAGGLAREEDRAGCMARGVAATEMSPHLRPRDRLASVSRCDRRAILEQDDRIISPGCMGLDLMARDHQLLFEAEELLQRAIADCERVLSPERIDIPALQNVLRNPSKTFGHYSDVGPGSGRAVTACEQALDPEDAHLGVCLSIFGKLLQATGCYGQAGPLHLRCLDIIEKLFRPGHLQLARRLDNHAALLDELGRSEDAAALRSQTDRVRKGHGQR